MSGTGCSASYDLPSESLQRLLAPEGFLAPLPRKVEGITWKHTCEIHVYCGLTCLVKTAERKRGRLGRIAQDIRQ